jgi:Sec7-like guanine-nucleotide exchange factor
MITNLLRGVFFNIEMFWRFWWNLVFLLHKRKEITETFSTYFWIRATKMQVQSNAVFVCLLSLAIKIAGKNLKVLNKSTNFKRSGGAKDPCHFTAQPSWGRRWASRYGDISIGHANRIIF